MSNDRTEAAAAREARLKAALKSNMARRKAQARARAADPPSRDEQGKDEADGQDRR